MYCGHARLCVCLSAAACPHYCTDPDVTWGSGIEDASLVVHCWVDLQSVHGLRCYGNITRTRNVSEYMLVLALCLVYFDVAFCAAESTFAFSPGLGRSIKIQTADAVTEAGNNQRTCSADSFLSTVSLFLGLARPKTRSYSACIVGSTIRSHFVGPIADVAVAQRHARLIGVANDN